MKKKKITAFNQGYLVFDAQSMPYKKDQILPLCINDALITCKCSEHSLIHF